VAAFQSFSQVFSLVLIVDLITYGLRKSTSPSSLSEKGIGILGSAESRWTAVQRRTSIIGPFILPLCVIGPGREWKLPPKAIDSKDYAPLPRHTFRLGTGPWN